jgi:hypothetical protein
VQRLLAAVGEEGKEEIMTAADQLMERGREQGREQGQREIVLAQLRGRFGALPDAVVARVTAAGMAELRVWSMSLLTAPALDDVFAAS